MRPSAGNVVTPDPVIWAGAAAGAAGCGGGAAGNAGGQGSGRRVAMSLGRYRLQGQPQQNNRPEHLDRAARCLIIPSRPGCSMRRPRAVALGWRGRRSR